MSYYIGIKINFKESSMSMPVELREMIEQCGGTFTTAQANEVGISNERLRLLVRAGLLERASFGVYVTPDTFIDKMYVAQLRRKRIIYSHETALYLHDLTDRDPLNYSVTVPTGYNALMLHADSFKVHAVKKELFKIGTVQMQTVFGNTITAYGLERTICDCMRNRNQMDLALLTDAIKRYVSRPDKDLITLMKMAETFKVSKPLQNYLEVLL